MKFQQLQTINGKKKKSEEVKQTIKGRSFNCGQHGHWAKDCNKDPKKIDK